MANKPNYKGHDSNDPKAPPNEHHVYGMEHFTDPQNVDWGQQPEIHYENPNIPPEVRAAYIQKTRLKRLRFAADCGHKLTPEQRAEINRANAQKSTGPRTAAGKAKSSLNSRRHGLTGQFTLMFGEDEEAYNLFALRLITSYKPVGAEEENLAQFLIDVSFLLNRSTSVELSSYAYDVLGAANRKTAPSLPGTPSHAVIAQIDAVRDDCAGPRATDWIGRHRGRLQRLFSKMHDSLRLLQSERRAVEAETRKLKTEFGSAYCAEIHGPFPDAAFDPAQSPAFAYYAAGVGLDPSKLLNKLHKHMLQHPKTAPATAPPTTTEATPEPLVEAAAQPPNPPAVEPDPPEKNNENEAGHAAQTTPVLPQIPALLVADFLPMPGQQHPPVALTREFLTDTTQILPGGTCEDKGGDPHRGGPPISSININNGPLLLLNGENEEEGNYRDYGE